MPHRKLDLVLLWHMHQPDYRDYRNGEFTLPWVYLHAVKDYADMAYHLEAHPGVRAVVNFAPVLLDQLEAYAEQFAMGETKDPLLRLLAASNLDRLDQATRSFILESCFKSNHTTMIEPFPAYKRLYELYRTLSAQGEGALSYLSSQYLADLLTWYHLAWTGESVRRTSETVKRLLAQGEGYSHADRFELFNLIGELIQELIPRFRKLAELGRIELSTTPHYHPLAPLLIDFKSAREAQPEIALPETPSYPEGMVRARFHLDSALASHAQRFGAAPQGVWPAEGGVSKPFLELLAARGCRWAASGEAVLANSLRKARTGQPLPDKGRYLYRPYRVEGKAGAITCFFRDDRLSDLIGFEYCKWFGKDAAQHFVQQLEAIAAGAPEGTRPVVSVILDGENAWEYYPYNGYYFLDDLYSALETHPFIVPTTFRDYLARGEGETPLPELVAGSWVYGTFSTWIGDKDKNKAWDLLCQAKASLDRVLEEGHLREEERAEALGQLAACEASDWFWWFGDYNPEQAVASFDRLFRDKLAHLYRLLKLPVPESLSAPISRGRGYPEAGGAMRRSS